MVDLADIAWNFAMHLARSGDFSELIELLRKEKWRPTPEAREFLAEVLEKRLVRVTGRPRKLAYRKIVSIRLAWGHVKMMRRSYGQRELLEHTRELNKAWKTQGRSLRVNPQELKDMMYPPPGKLMKQLAREHGVSSATIKAVVGRRGRFKK